MPRPKVSSRTYEVPLSNEAAELLEGLCTLGVYGKTPSEVIRKLVEEGIANLVYEQKVFSAATQERAAMAQLVRKRK